MVFWENEEHEVAYSWLRVSKCGLGMVFCWLWAIKVWLLAVKMGSPRVPRESRCSLLSPLETYKSSLLGKIVPGLFLRNSED
eukprot:4840241-Pyramimonas_sp.AAC.1